jgi:arabinosyltransferase C
VPTFTPITTVLGNRPTFLEWPVGLVHPCAQPFNIRDGIAEMPAYRVTAGDDYRQQGQGWSASNGGGPLGWLNVNATVRRLPTFLKGQTDSDWGTLYAIDPYEPNAQPASAAEQVAEETHWGWYSLGPMPRPINLPSDPPKSDSRTGGSTGTTNNR